MIWALGNHKCLRCSPDTSLRSWWVVIYPRRRISEAFEFRCRLGKALVADLAGGNATAAAALHDAIIDREVRVDTYRSHDISGENARLLLAFLRAVAARGFVYSPED